MCLQPKAIEEAKNVLTKLESMGFKSFEVSGFCWGGKRFDFEPQKGLHLRMSKRLSLLKARNVQNYIVLLK